MKRIKTIAAVLGIALLCFAATAMAGETSFYDTTNEWIVRAYTEQNTTDGRYSIFVEILDEEGDYFEPASEILWRVHGQVLTANPLLIDANQMDSEVSLAHKAVSGGTEIFVFGNEDNSPGKIHNNTTLSRDWPVPPANISVNYDTLAFGNVNVGSSSTSYITVSNTGEADLILGAIAVSGTGFSREGGTCSENVHVLATPCTIGIKFSPTQATTYTGNLAIPSNDSGTPTANVSLTGTGIVQQAGAIDIGFNAYPPIDAASALCNGLSFNVTVKVTNSGTQPSGPFAVKIYLSLDKNVSAQDIYLGTWNVSNVDAKGTLTYTFSNLMANGLAIHMAYYVLAHADANNTIPNEISETNNVAYRITSVAR